MNYLLAATTPQIGIRFFLREGERTVDFRTIDVNCINFDRDPPYPIMLQRTRPESGGHGLADLAGVIKRAGRFDTNVIVAEGYLADNEAGHSLIQLVSEGVLQTWSPDMGNPITKDIKGIEHLTSATFIGATCVPFPAVDSAVIELFDLTTGEVIMPAPTRTGPVAASNLTLTSAGYLVYTLPSSTAPSLTAHAAPPAPPADFFTDPNFTSLQRFVTITADGRFTTHLAAWGECHVGYGDMCVSPPREADYSHFSVGTVLTSDGTTIPTGVIAITGGHADINLDAASARSKYDDTATGKVDVAIGTDEFGIWASGAMRPNATEEDVHTLRASGVSGDWRMIDGELRLIGICSVNVPGFPKLAMAASADGHMEALVAAGGPPLPHPSLCGCNDAAEIESLKKLVADAGITDIAIEKLSSRIPADEAEVEELYARIN